MEKQYLKTCKTKNKAFQKKKTEFQKIQQNINFKKHFPFLLVEFSKMVIFSKEYRTENLARALGGHVISWRVESGVNS